MSSEEDEVRQATLSFYQALDDLLLGKGTDAMSEAWHHCDLATTVHPFGSWAEGWDEVWNNWRESAAIFAYYRGHAARSDGIGTIHNLRIAAISDNTAYVYGIYKSTMYFPDGPKPLAVNCTNILMKRDGKWKMIHHHSDQAPADYQQSIANLIG